MKPSDKVHRPVLKLFTWNMQRLQQTSGSLVQVLNMLTNRATSNELLHVQVQSRPPNPLLPGLDCFPNTQMSSICTTMQLLEQLIPTTFKIWDNQLKATIAIYTIHQLQAMYVSHAKVGAIALG